MRVLRRCHWRTTMMEGLTRFRSNTNRPSVGIIVIGNEVLKAQVKDTNSSYACKLLYKHGIKVDKISIVRDNVEAIAEDVEDFCKRYDYVVTSGGIGPTHDDVTYEAVALAFNDTMHYHPTLVDIVKNHFNSETFSSSAYKMAYIPTKSVLKFGVDKDTGKSLRYPCIICENVYIFPGSPMFFETSFQAIYKESFGGCNSFVTAELFINAREESYASILSEVVKECRDVSFGSYPERNRYYKARVTIESESEKDTETAKKMFCDRLPANVLIHYDCAPHVDCLAKYETLIKNSERRLQYENCYQRPEEVYVYLDGSEESVLMIHFARIAVNKLRRYCKRKLHALYFMSDVLRPGMKEFVCELGERYDVELHRLEDDQIGAVCALKDFVVSRPESRVLVIVGKRSDGNEREIYDDLAQLSDECLIPLRVYFPIIEWSDEDVLCFFRSLSLPCFMHEVSVGGCGACLFKFKPDNRPLTNAFPVQYNVQYRAECK